MGLFIDTPLWPWRGRLWAHLISDLSLDELHQAARKLGVRYVFFGRDHYDISEDRWDEVIETATVVDPREIVRTLRRAGLRHRGGKASKSWCRHDDLPEFSGRAAVVEWLNSYQAVTGAPSVEILCRPGECVVLHLFDQSQRPDSVGVDQGPPLDACTVIETVANGWYSLELVIKL